MQQTALIRYDCPESGYPGAYVMLNTLTRDATGYYSDGRVRWETRYIPESSERTDIAMGYWVLPVIPAELRLPEGF